MDKKIQREKVVEVFKTNVRNDFSAEIVITALKTLVVDARINFDLDDCDKILRIESNTYLDITSIVAIVKKNNFEIEPLE